MPEYSLDIPITFDGNYQVISLTVGDELTAYSERIIRAETGLTVRIGLLLYSDDENRTYLKLMSEYSVYFKELVGSPYILAAHGDTLTISVASHGKKGVAEATAQWLQRSIDFTVRHHALDMLEALPSISDRRQVVAMLHYIAEMISRGSAWAYIDIGPKA